MIRRLLTAALLAATLLTACTVNEGDFYQTEALTWTAHNRQWPGTPTPQPFPTPPLIPQTDRAYHRTSWCPIPYTTLPVQLCQTMPGAGWRIYFLSPRGVTDGPIIPAPTHLQSITRPLTLLETQHPHTGERVTATWQPGRTRVLIRVQTNSSRTHLISISPNQRPQHTILPERP